MGWRPGVREAATASGKFWKHTGRAKRWMAPVPTDVYWEFEVEG